ncbi:hypothetical protein D3C87_1410700 [compost metagenome]
MTELHQERFRMGTKNGNLLATKTGQADFGRENYGICMMQPEIKNGKKKPINSVDF